eukprot:364959-Chlamydomonas_euryale.AAC.3
MENFGGCGRRSHHLPPLGAYKMDPQGRQDLLSAIYLCFDRQLAMEQPSTQLVKAGPGVPLVSGKRSKALRQTTMQVPCSQPALPIVGAKRSSDSVDKKPKQAWYWDERGRGECMGEG